MVRYLICQALGIEYTQDPDWLGLADGFADAFLIWLLLG
jgi:hypothetical protein